MPSDPPVPLHGGPVGTPHRPSSEAASTRDSTPRREVSRALSAPKPRAGSTASSVRAPNTSTPINTAASARRSSSVGSKPVTQQILQPTSVKTSPPGAKSATASSRSASASSVKRSQQPSAPVAMAPRETEIALRLAPGDAQVRGLSFKAKGKAAVPAAASVASRPASLSGTASRNTQPSRTPSPARREAKSRFVNDFFGRDNFFDLLSRERRNGARHAVAELKSKTDDKDPLYVFQLLCLAQAAPLLEEAARSSVKKLEASDTATRLLNEALSRAPVRSLHFFA